MQYTPLLWEAFLYSYNWCSDSHVATGNRVALRRIQKNLFDMWIFFFYCLQFSFLSEPWKGPLDIRSSVLTEAGQIFTITDCKASVNNFPERRSMGFPWKPVMVPVVLIPHQHVKHFLSTDPYSKNVSSIVRAMIMSILNPIS